MKSTSPEEAPTVVEPAMVQDIFVSGFLPLEDLGANFRLTAYVDLVLPGTTEPVHVVIARLVMSKDETVQSIGKLAGSLKMRLVGPG